MTIFRLQILVITSIAVILSGCGKVASPSAQNLQTGPGKEIRVYYFHRTLRCPNCLKIESLARETVQTFFPVELESGTVQWHAVNVDEEDKKHFVDDYGLSTQTLIVAEFSGGKQSRWKNLDKVWDLLDNDVDFGQYVEMEIRDYL
ncbi:MAG: hypothetical protein BWX80_00865 [Candidatus Hydrogenedentes bacterium ADurb.Bin101]|nr:MAG: hypothetical protein BWX80_00865 [Candidatus Hydrogenedentes bacterium ADurb.Bin101]HOC68114.1 nitrophenyl compound nitroreductase subunit ArsF family protein [Candidatus Hydrogenedentota bacterium]